MMRSLLAVLLSAALPGICVGWSSDPRVHVPVCSNAGPQIEARACSDGEGGSFVVWSDLRDDPEGDIYLQHVDYAGEVFSGWPADGLALCVESAIQALPTLVADGSGGAIVTWLDYRSGGDELYGQRIGSDGSLFWMADGVRISELSSIFAECSIASDDSGGAFVAWADLRPAGPINYCYAVRVTVDGTLATGWPDGGIPIATVAAIDPRIVSDGNGVAYASLEGAGIYVQRIEGSTVDWGSAGVLIGPGGSSHSLVADSEGVVVSWAVPEIDLGVGTDLLAQKILSSGFGVAPGWPAGGVVVCSADFFQTVPEIVLDGEGGTILCWFDSRAAGAIAPNDLYAQRLDYRGNALWAVDGVPVCVADGIEFPFSLVADGEGGIIASWYDSRAETTPEEPSDIYASRLTGDGVVALGWSDVAPGGTLVATAVDTATGSSPLLVFDGQGGGIVVWEKQSGLGDIVAMRIERFGRLGEPAPSILSVEDVPNDEGGAVLLTWEPSYLDRGPSFEIDSYAVWRETPAAMAAPALQSGRAQLASEGQSSFAGGQWIRMLTHQNETIYWELLGAQEARGFRGYSYTAATASDSVTAGPESTNRFMVEALDRGSLAFWGSEPVSGSSVDNLAPSAPSGFQARWTLQSAGAVQLKGSGQGGVLLAWNENDEGDLAVYRVYRGSTSTFTAGPENLIAETTALTLFDPMPPALNYKLAAVDVHGNESFTVAIASQDITGVSDSGAAAAFLLGPAVPNPVQNGTAIHFQTAEESHVTLAVFDVRGKIVRKLLDGLSPAGAGSAWWDVRDDRGNAVASGVYYYRLTAGGRWRSGTLQVVR